MLDPLSAATTRRTAAAALAALLAAGCSSAATTSPAVPTAIAAASGSPQTAVVGNLADAPLVAHVTDAAGNPVAGGMVTFTSTGGVTLGSSDGVSDATGNVGTRVTMGTTAGIDTVTATISQSNTPAIFVLTAAPGPVAEDSALAGDGQAGPAGVPLAAPLVVEVLDQYGNPLAGVTVTFAAPTGTLSAASAVTGTDGTASVQFTPAPGVNTVTTSVQGTDFSSTFTETGN